MDWSWQDGNCMWWASAPAGEESLTGAARAALDEAELHLRLYAVCGAAAPLYPDKEFFPPA